MSFIGRFLLGAAMCGGGLAAIAFYSVHEARKTCCAYPPEQPVFAKESNPPASVEPAVSAAAPSPAQPAPSASSPIGNPANQGLRINDAGLDIIKESEGLRLSAYSASERWYIGYGHSCADCAGTTITEAQADAFLREDVEVAEAAVKRRITVPLTENEFSAMVSLAYNIGSGNFAKSPVVVRLNDGDRQGAADAFRVHNRAGYRVIEHLTQRREKERALFLS